MKVLYPAGNCGNKFENLNFRITLILCNTPLCNTPLTKIQQRAYIFYTITTNYLRSGFSIKVVKIKPDEKEETNSDDKNQTDEGTKTIKIYKKNKDSLIAEINYIIDIDFRN